MKYNVKPLSRVSNKKVGLDRGMDLGEVIGEIGQMLDEAEVSFEEGDEKELIYLFEAIEKEVKIVLRVLT